MVIIANTHAQILTRHQEPIRALYTCRQDINSFRIGCRWAWTSQVNIISSIRLPPPLSRTPAQSDKLTEPNSDRIPISSATRVLLTILRLKSERRISNWCERWGGTIAIRCLWGRSSIIFNLFLSVYLLVHPKYPRSSHTVTSGVHCPSQVSSVAEDSLTPLPETQHLYFARLRSPQVS